MAPSSAMCSLGSGGTGERIDGAGDAVRLHQFLRYVLAAGRIVGGGDMFGGSVTGSTAGSSGGGNAAGGSDNGTSAISAIAPRTH